MEDFETISGLSPIYFILFYFVCLFVCLFVCTLKLFSPSCSLEIFLSICVGLVLADCSILDKIFLIRLNLEVF